MAASTNLSTTPTGISQAGVMGNTGLLTSAVNQTPPQPAAPASPQTAPPAKQTSGTIPIPRGSSLTSVPGPSTPTPTLQSLMTTNPGASTFDTSSAGPAPTTGAAPAASASLAGGQADILNGQINPNDATNSAAQLDAITNANSPYIQLAKQQGMLSAASRGLQNSSIGAGASEAAAVQAAAPLAQQNASEASTGQLQNSQLGTQANEFNASQENANQQLNAQLEGQTNQFNASQAQQAAATNAGAKNAMAAQTQQLQEALTQQYVSGSQAQTLASIQGQWNSLIQSNASAASMMTSTMNGIAATMANKDIAPSRAASTITADLTILNSSLAALNELEGGTAPSVATTPGSLVHG